MLSRLETGELLHDWNNTTVDYSESRLLHELIEAQVPKTPDAPALTFAGQTMPYLELNRRANQLAHRLRKLGIGPDVLVSVFLDRSFEMVIALLGILKAGGAYVPIDPEYPRDRLAAILEDSKVPILLCTEKSSKVLPAHRARVIRLDADWA